MTTAIILSMGMLVENVNNHIFITRMLMKAKCQNPEFNFTMALLEECLLIASDFNRSILTKEEFMDKILNAMGNIKINPNDFWRDWNDIIKIGNIKQSLLELKSFCDSNQCIIYLTSDTNSVHLDKLKTECAAANISFITESIPNRIDEFPLYASCVYKKSRFELTQTVIADIKAKNFNKPDMTIVVLVDPENIKDETLRNTNKLETKTIQKWCNENQVKLVLHKTDKHLIKALEAALDKAEHRETFKKTA